MIEYPVSKAAHALMHALRFSKGRGVVGSEVIVTRMCCVLDEEDVTYFWRGSRVALIPGSMEMEGPGMMQQQQQQHRCMSDSPSIHPRIRCIHGSCLAAHVACSLERTSIIHGCDVTVD